MIKNKAHLYLYYELNKINSFYGDVFLVSLNTLNIDNIDILTKTIKKSQSCNYIDNIEDILSPINSPALFKIIKYNTPYNSFDAIDIRKKFKKSSSLSSINDDYETYKPLLYTDNAYLVPKHIQKLLQDDI